MREAAFLQQNRERWQKLEQIVEEAQKANPDDLAEAYIQITDDLAYARTYYPNTQTMSYLNAMAARIYLMIYRNRKEKSNRFITFWWYELPLEMRAAHLKLLYAFLFFMGAMFIGVISAANDQSFVRLILGDGYVNMTLENIEKGDPMAVYKQMYEVDMFFAITFNNIMVSFTTFSYGLLLSLGTVYILFKNGVMLGSFQYFFVEKGLFWTSFTSVWIHGTIEISSIVIAGAAGLCVGNSILFPQTYSRLESFKRGAKSGLKIIIGLVPMFVIAGFLESFITRHTEFPDFVKLLIIIGSAFFIIYYFVLYPILLERKILQNPNWWKNKK